MELVVNPGDGVYLAPSPASEAVLSGHGHRPLKGKRSKSSASRHGDEAYGGTSGISSASDICVTDSASADPQERLLIPANANVEMCLYDQWGNVAEYPHSSEYVCVCQVKYQRGFDNPKHANYVPTQDDSSVCALRLPTLEGANGRGYLKGQRTGEGSYTFSSLALEAFADEAAAAGGHSHGADGELNLVFSLLSTEFVDNDDINGNDYGGNRGVFQKLEVESHKVVFKFTSDETHAHARRLVSDQLQVLYDTSGSLLIVPL
jgi:hypothetical protein